MILQINLDLLESRVPYIFKLRVNSLLTLLDGPVGRSSEAQLELLNTIRELGLDGWNRVEILHLLGNAGASYV